MCSESSGVNGEKWGGILWILRKVLFEYTHSGKVWQQEDDGKIHNYANHCHVDVDRLHWMP